jgi:hypothetical protein
MRSGHRDHPRTRPAITYRDQKTELRCSRTLEHKHGKLRTNAEDLCPRPELNPYYMVILREELVLPH